MVWRLSEMSVMPLVCGAGTPAIRAPDAQESRCNLALLSPALSLSAGTRRPPHPASRSSGRAAGSLSGVYPFALCPFSLPQRTALSLVPQEMSPHPVRPGTGPPDHGSGHRGARRGGPQVVQKARLRSSTAPKGLWLSSIIALPTTTPPRPTHIEWLRIGTHDIFD